MAGSSRIILYVNNTDAIKPAARWQRTLQGLALVLLLLFFAAYWDKTSNTVLFFDSGWHATVAKNLAEGHGYASSYHGFKPFDPDVTTGPVPIGIMALAIATTDNHYWLPATVQSLLNLTLLVLVLLAIRRLGGVRACVAAATAVGLLLTFFEERWWHIFTGDMPSLLLGCLSLALLVAGTHRRSIRYLMVSGLLSGAAVLSKSVGVVMLLAGLCYLLLLAKRKTHLAAGAALVFCIGVTLPNAIWLGLKDTPAQGKPAMDRAVVGISQLIAAPDKAVHIRKSLKISQSALNRKLGRYGAPANSFWILPFAIMLLTVIVMLKRSGHWHHFLLCLCIASLGFWAWHLFLNVSPLSKYGLYPLWLSLFTLLLAISGSRVPWLAPVLVILWITVAPVRSQDAVFKFFSFGYPNDFYRDHVESIAEQVVAYRSSKAQLPLAACGWQSIPWQLEFVLPEANNFSDCYQMLDEAVIEDAATGRKYFDPDIDLGFVLISERVLWKLRQNNWEPHRIIEATCGRHILYENEGFRMLRCDDQAIRRSLDPNKYTSFSER